MTAQVYKTLDHFTSTLLEIQQIKSGVILQMVSAITEDWLESCLHLLLSGTATKQTELIEVSGWDLIDCNCLSITNVWVQVQIWVSLAGSGTSGRLGTTRWS